MIKVTDRKDRNTAGVGYARKQGGRNAVSNQNQFGGGRYGIGEEVKKGTQRALSNAEQTKANKAETGAAGTPVTINPEKSIIGQTFN